MKEIDREIQERIDGVKWYHEFDFGDGVKSKACVPSSKRTHDFVGQVNFTGKTVLDIGCWDGYWSFHAERNGAQSVLATDMNSQRLAKFGETFRPAEVSDNEGFVLAHEIYESRVEYRGNVSVYDVARLGKRFDIVLFLGVFYHLTHPMYAITQIRHAIAAGGEVIIEGEGIDDTELAYTEFYYRPPGEDSYFGDASNWFVPTRRCLRDMVTANYFDVVREDFAPGKGKYGRILLHARAAERSDDKHLYRPLFGLDQYDQRFR